MPLSNWDALAFNENAENCIAILTHPNGSLVSISKNQLVLENQEYGVLLHLNEGSFVFEDLIMTADRSCQQKAIFFFAAYYDENMPEDELLDDDDDSDLVDDEDDLETAVAEYEFKIITGIGCEGYRNAGPDLLAANGIDVPENLWGEVTVEHHSSKNKGHYCVVEYPDESGIMQEFECPITEDLMENENSYVGVTAELYEEFLCWLRRTVTELEDLLEGESEINFYRQWLERIEAGVPMRYNQGDVFFLNADEIRSVPNSRIGSAKSPMLDSLLDQEKS